MATLAKDQTIWLFILFLCFSVLLLAYWDPSLRPQVLDLFSKTLLPLFLREVVSGALNPTGR
jgi:hypothetical protein